MRNCGVISSLYLSIFCVVHEELGILNVNAPIYVTCRDGHRDEI